MPISDKWQNVSETTRYTHWSQPIEVSDINNNHVSSRMADTSTKVVASSNCKITEMYASGAEYAIDDTYLDEEVKGVQYRSNTMAHTGTYSLRISTKQKAFETILKANEHKAGKYKISIWAYGNNDAAANDVKINIDGVLKPFNGEVVKAGSWVQLNHYTDLNEEQVQIAVQTTPKSSYTMYYLDDFRIHPVYATMTTYVYDNKTDEIISVLDKNNMGVTYEYDVAGRLIKTYSEIENTSELLGGFKIMNQNRYHYNDNQDQ